MLKYKGFNIPENLPEANAMSIAHRTPQVVVSNDDGIRLGTSITVEDIATGKISLEQMADEFKKFIDQREDTN